MSDSGIVVRVGIPAQVKGEGALETSFFSYPITLKLADFDAERQFSRRYSDFDSLRSQLGASYWASVIPPIPEKESALDQLSKLTPVGKAETDILEHRRNALRHFLIRVSHHPVLGHAPLLRMFADDTQWRQCLREPVKQPKFITASLTEGLTKPFMTNAVPREVAAAAYNRATRSDTVDAPTWDATRAYMAQLEGDLRRLRDRVQSLAQRRRAAGAALREFGEAFGQLADGEDDAGLHQIIAAVEQRSRGIGDVYVDHAEQELTRMSGTLSYYVGMCAAVQETMRHIQNATQYTDHLAKRAQELQAQLARGGSGMEHVQSDLYYVTEQRQRLTTELQEAERSFRADFVRFHRDKQSDMKELLKVAAEMEVSFADRMKNEWSILRQSITELTTT